MSVFGVFLVHILLHSDWIRTRKTPNTDTFHTMSIFITLRSLKLTLKLQMHNVLMGNFQHGFFGNALLKSISNSRGKTTWKWKSFYSLNNIKITLIFFHFQRFLIAFAEVKAQTPYDFGSLYYKLRTARSGKRNKIKPIKLFHWILSQLTI